MDHERTDAVRRRITEAHRLKNVRMIERLRHDLMGVRQELLQARNRWADMGAEHQEMGRFLVSLANRLGQIQAALDGDDTTVAARIVPPG